VQSSAVPDPLATPARVAFAGDWHANTRWAVAAVTFAAERGADVIVQLGDFGYEYRAAFLDGLERALSRTGLRLLFVDGNHEDFPTLLRYPVRRNGCRQDQPVSANDREGEGHHNEVPHFRSRRDAGAKAQPR
jgi:predicted phosphodiesterase